MEARVASAGLAGAGLDEAARLSWREDASERTLRRDGLRWTAWTVWISAVFCVPGVLLLVLEPLTFPAAAICFLHAWAIPRIQARRGARQLVPVDSERSDRVSQGRDDPERVALGLLGDLVGHAERDLLTETGLALQAGGLGVWLVGEQGAFCIRPGGRRIECWCVRVSELAELPAGDRVAHLLLALREDELGFAKVANLGFSGAPWRVLPHLEARSRPALAVARQRARA